MERIFQVFLAMTGMVAMSLTNPSPNPFPAPADLFRAHPRYREPTLQERRFKHRDIVPLLKALPPSYRLGVLGKSWEGRDIYRASLGNGPISVLLWSQMHGDEPTATMALFDVFRFFAQHDEFDHLRDQLLSKLTIHVVPMLNPDGAERFTRRNVQDIDINRDALRLQTPEGQILKAVRDSVQAAWGFNLHDQSRYYAVGNAPSQAAFSFLAPAFDEVKTMEGKRQEAAQLIGLLNRTIQEFVPGGVGKYDDTFEPRAFGDNIQRWGTRTILIESGALPDDREKQTLRRIHFVILLTALQAIAEDRHREVPLGEYEAIPFNNSNAFHDLILRNCLLPGTRSRFYMADLAYRADEVQGPDNRTFYLSSKISELGDLSTFFGFRDEDMQGARVVPGKVYGTVLPDFGAVRKLDAAALLREGITYVPVTTFKKTQETAGYPLHLMAPGSPLPREFRIGLNPSFLLERNGKFTHALVNGQLWDLQQDFPH